MMYFTRVGLLEDMINLFGGLGFRYMDLFDVDGTRLLLDICAKTLETLRLYPGDPRGKELSLDSVQVLADGLQLSCLFKTLIYHETSRCGHSRSWQGILLANVSWNMRCQPSHPLRSSKSLHSIGTSTSTV